MEKRDENKSIIKNEGGKIKKARMKEKKQIIIEKEKEK